MKGSRRILGLLSVLVIGCGVVDPGVVRAPEAPFPKAFVDATDWAEFEIGSLPGAPDRLTSLDALLHQLDGFLAAGILGAGPEAGVTMTVPDGAQSAREVHVFVTMSGSTGGSAGTQMRLVIHRDARGWWLDPKGQWMIFCDHVLPPGKHICD